MSWYGNIIDPGNIFGLNKPEGNVYGTKPKPVPVPTADEILKEASLANLNNADNINKLAAGQNEFNLDQALKEFERVAPGVFPKLIENITAGARGELSPDESGAIWRETAARGIDSGTSGSLFNTKLGLRDIGRTAEFKQQQAQNNFQSLMKGALPNLFDSSRMFQMPQYEPYAKFQNELYNKKVQAAPNPEDAGVAAADVARQESLLGAYAGTPHSTGTNSNPWGNPPSTTKDNLGNPNLYEQPSWTGTYGETGGVGAFNF